MFKRLFIIFFMVFLTSSFVMGQALRVALPRDSIYAGEPLNLTLSVENEQLSTATVKVVPEIPMRVTSTRINNINGRVSSALILTGIPPTAGEYKLLSVEATTASGESLSTTLNKTFTVTTLQQDKDIHWSIEISPKRIYVGDHYQVTYTMRAPALHVNGEWVSPFLQQSFFGQWAPGQPAVRIQLPELNVVGQKESERIEDSTYVYECTCEIVAEQADSFLLYGGHLPRQQRATEVVNGKINFTHTYAVGKPMEVVVVQPPEEGRPLYWTGATAQTFDVSACVDALNVVVGDPVKLTIDILTDANEKYIRTMPLDDIADFHFVTDPERVEIKGGCRFIYTFRPTRDGLLEIPEIPFGFFNRQTETYETVYTQRIPLRVAPMPKLYYTFGETGTLRMESEFPPPLRMTMSEQPRQSISKPCLWGLLLSIITLFIVFCKGVWIRGIRLLVMPLSWFLPKVRLRFSLRAARSPEEVLVVVRRWTRRPSLTPEEVERLNTSTSVLKVAQAMRQLEAARYTSDETQWRDAVVTLCKHLTKVKFLIAFTFSLLGLSLSAMPETYQLEQAQVITQRCEAKADFRLAANHWLALIHQGDISKHTLLNAASTTFLAEESKLSRLIVRHCEELYGRDGDSQQMIAAIDQYYGHSAVGPFAWLLSVHLKFPYGVRLDLCVIVLTFLLFSFVLRLKVKRLRHILRIVRLALFILLFLIAMSLWETFRWRSSNSLPKTLPVSSVMEDVQ